MNIHQIICARVTMAEETFTLADIKDVTVIKSYTAAAWKFLAKRKNESRYMSQKDWSANRKQSRYAPYR